MNMTQTASLAQATSELNEAQEILMAEVPDEMRNMSIQEFNLTPIGKVIRRINIAIEIIDDIEEQE